MVVNAGTPLMWAGCLQLAFGNILLGFFESWLIRLRRPAARRGAGPMIAANYASMLVGLGLVWLASPLREAATRDPFRYALPTILGLWVVSFLLTVFIEGPFVARTAGLGLGGRPLLVSLWVQAVSYLVLIAIVSVVGSISAVTQLRRAEIGEMRTVAGWLYYLSSDGVSVMRVRLDGSKIERVARLAELEGGSFSRITIEPTIAGDRARLMYRSFQQDRELVKDLGAAGQCAPIEGRAANGLALLGNNSFGPFSTRAFRDQPKVRCGYWALEGIHIGDRWLAFETPFLSLSWRSPVVLPDGKVVAQFGDAFVLVDPETAKAAKLADGQMGGDVLLDLPARG